MQLGKDVFKTCMGLKTSLQLGDFLKKIVALSEYMNFPISKLFHLNVEQEQARACFFRKRLKIKVILT